MAISILHHHHSSHLLFESQLGKIAFVAEFCPQARSKSHEISTHCSSQPGFAVGGSISPPTAGSTPLFESFVPPSIVPDRSPNSNDDCMVRRLEDRMGLVQLTDLFFSGKWSPIQSLMYINVLELLAVQLTLVRLPRCMSVLVM